jgi:hypothetical protein
VGEIEIIGLSAPLNRSEQRNFFPPLCIKSRIALARFSPFKSKMDESTGTE